MKYQAGWGLDASVSFGDSSLDISLEMIPVLLTGEMKSDYTGGMSKDYVKGKKGYI